MKKVLLQIAWILIFTKAGGLLARKCKMPEVLGALIAGVLLGPAVLRLVAYDSHIELLSDLGVIMLMFLAGLETNLAEFRKAGLSALAIAAAGITVPLVLGTLSAYLFFQNFWENVFIGVILTATSVSITVETLGELGRLNTRAGINILGAAVIDDILGLILISVILAASGGQGKGNGSLFSVVVGIVVFCAFSFAAVVWLPGALNKLLGDKPLNRTFLAFSIAAALLAAFAAESFGVAAITGAYLCGLTLSQLVHKETLERGLKTICSGFLSPIFFASVGIEADLDGFGLKTLLIALVMFTVAVIGKIAGCGIAARAFHMKRSESLQIGVGMVSRGEVALLTANIGLQAGIITNAVFLPTIAVVILTTVITPVLLRFSFSLRLEKARKKRPAR